MWKEDCWFWLLGKSGRKAWTVNREHRRGVFLQPGLAPCRDTQTTTNWQQISFTLAEEQQREVHANTLWDFWFLRCLEQTGYPCTAFSLPRRNILSAEKFLWTVTLKWLPRGTNRRKQLQKQRQLSKLLSSKVDLFLPIQKINWATETTRLTCYKKEHHQNHTWPYLITGY